MPALNASIFIGIRMTVDRLDSRAPSRHRSRRGADAQSPSGRTAARGEPAPGQAVENRHSPQYQPFGHSPQYSSSGHSQQYQPSQTSQRSGHSAPQSGAQPVSALQILIALLVAPLAWLAQVGIAEMVLGQSCVGGAPLFVVHALAWTRLSVVAASLVCLILGAFGTFVAWRILWRTAHIPWRFPSALRGTRAERDWFLSRIGAMSSTMFMLGLMTTELAMLVIAPCSPW